MTSISVFLLQMNTYNIFCYLNFELESGVWWCLINGSWSGWRANRWDTQGDGTRGGAVVSFSQSSSFTKAPVTSLKTKTERQKDMREKNDVGIRGQIRRKNCTTDADEGSRVELV